MEKEQSREICTNPHIGDFFLFYLNSDVTPRERKRIEAHLATCISCQRELAFFTVARKIGKREALKGA